MRFILKKSRRDLRAVSGIAAIKMMFGSLIFRQVLKHLVVEGMSVGFSFVVSLTNEDAVAYIAVGTSHCVSAYIGYWAVGKTRGKENRNIR